MDEVQVVAFYLPQFHPVPENDEWWGMGFTEWRNVVAAEPRFRGHHQPQLPSDLGFYDLRVPEVRELQASLAREYGIHGFCYYHYWFNGRRILERPFDEVLASGRPDLPFCLCWANENWTRVWDGGSREVLLEQVYSPADDIAHLRSLAPAFADPRYIRVQGKPLFLVYRASHLPDPKATTDRWRAEAHRLGVGDLFLCKVEGFLEDTKTPPHELGFDAATGWIPDHSLIGPPLRRALPWKVLRRLHVSEQAYRRNMVFDYDAVAARMVELQRPPGYPRFPCVTPMWDNSPRRAQGALILRGSTPERYQAWLEEAARQATRSGLPAPIVFVNAWNEWAEGNHLEPDLRHGRAYLEATRAALRAVSRA